MTEIMRFDITDESFDALAQACVLAFSNNPNATFSNWHIDKVAANEDWHTPVDDAMVDRIILLKGPEKGSHPLPAPLGCKGAASMLWAFLQNTKYGPEPDHDGFNKKGWRLCGGGYGLVEQRRAILTLEPRWMLYGK